MCSQMPFNKILLTLVPRVPNGQTVSVYVLFFLSDLLSYSIIAAYFIASVEFVSSVYSRVSFSAKDHISEILKYP